ncbi:peptidoglycan DL-endopeptidase CwlO [Lentibacillus populi]|uniref:Peptidoglycan DL-endopeptidase CwlO n=1 Tax=Lentibacillus populi TaxID=1827502 RepID=A0A9W5X4X9_9BACI|nr:C40 family peptidase [Lentibacillus populi]GGB36147.1 peptidoglycan DL-endopeptidase CwlO [Lentibacillus populi]
MKKTIVTMSTVAVVGLTSAFFAETAHAEKTVSQIHDERSEIKVNLSNAEAKIAQVLLDLEDLNKKIARVDGALAENKKQVKETEDKIKDTKQKVDELEEEIAVLEDKIEERFEIMKERIVAYQKNGGDVQYLEVLFGSKSFGDFISRSSAVSKISDADADLMKQQEADKKAVEKKQAAVEEKLDELNDMKAEQEAIQDTILEQKEQNEAAKQELKDKEAQLKEMKANLEGKDSNLAALEADIRSSMEAANNDTPSVSGESNGSSSSHSTTSKPSVKATTATVPSGSTGSAITAGNKYIGNSVYVWGGGRSAYDVQHGRFDCSGFVSWAYRQEGISLPASTAGLSGVGSKVSYSNIQPGDLVFFDTDGRKNGHVGIYIGGGQFIGSQSSTGVAKVSMSNPYWSKAFKGHVRRVK